MINLVESFLPEHLESYCPECEDWTPLILLLVVNWHRNCWDCGQITSDTDEP